MAEQLTLNRSHEPPDKGPFSYFMRTRKLSWMVRANDQFRFKDQSVAEHTFNVAHLALWICDEENLLRGSSERLSRELVMEKALFHDVPECVVGDMSYRVKKMAPELAALFDQVEKLATRELVFDGLADSIKARYISILNDDDPSEEGKIVRYADMLEVLFYAFTELKAGNKHFQEIWVNAGYSLKNRVPYECVKGFLHAMDWELQS